MNFPTICLYIALSDLTSYSHLWYNWVVTLPNEVKEEISCSICPSHWYVMKAFSRGSANMDVASSLSFKSAIFLVMCRTSISDSKPVRYHNSHNNCWNSQTINKWFCHILQYHNCIYIIVCAHNNNYNIHSWQKLNVFIVNKRILVLPLK